MATDTSEKDVQEVKKQTVKPVMLQEAIEFVEKEGANFSFKKPSKRVVCRVCPKSMWTIENSAEEGKDKLECYCKVQFTNKWSSEDPRPNEVSFCAEINKVD